MSIGRALDRRRPAERILGFRETSESNQIRAASAPNAQWPAVSTTVGDISVPLHRHAGVPFTSKTSKPT
jgi:hypothetical protein